MLGSGIHRDWSHRRLSVAFLGALSALLMLVLPACGDASTDLAASSSAPPDLKAPPAALRWVAFNNVEVPVSEAGPSDYTGPSATGYDHTPQGAAVAAINALVRLGVATDDEVQAVSVMVAPGAGRDRWLMNRVLQSLTPPPPGSAPIVLGYTITGYTDLSAHLQITTRYPDDSLLSTMARVVWRDQDWRIAFPDDPNAASAVAALRTIPDHTVMLR